MLLDLQDYGGIFRYYQSVITILLGELRLKNFFALKDEMGEIIVCRCIRSLQLLQPF
jgi:hypothetical protein